MGSDLMRATELARRFETNNEVRWMLCEFLENDACAITPELLALASRDGILPDEPAYTALLCGFCGLDPDAECVEARRLLQEYFAPAVRKLDPNVYRADPFFRDVQLVEASEGDWELTFQAYAPCEAFVRDDLLMLEGHREVPRIGFFAEEFRFPALLENGRDWMAVKPSEIETSRTAIRRARGNVVVFGLGIGYYAYHASLKEEVDRVVVVERSEAAIALFQRQILPRFARPDKVRLVQADAFDFAQGAMARTEFDVAFVDLWHDASDAVDPYLRMRALEPLHPRVEFHYWLEDTILSALRWNLFPRALETAESFADLLRMLESPWAHPPSK